MIDSNNKSAALKPMGLISSLLHFGIPSVICFLSIYWVMQKLHRDGVNDFTNFYFSLVTPLALMLVASIIDSIQYICSA